MKYILSEYLDYLALAEVGHLKIYILGLPNCGTMLYI